MGVLSKFFGTTLGMRLLTTNCYETAHTWAPSCYQAIRITVWKAWIFSFKTYFTIYLMTALTNVKDPRKVNWGRLIKDATRSATFLTSNLIGYIFWLCRIRQALGFFIWPSLGLINGLLASFFAILLEQKKRRGMLALYLTNLASETAFRMSVNHGYLKIIPRGECLVFSIGLAGLFYMHHADNLHKQTANALKLLFMLKSKAILPLERFPAILRRFFSNLRSLGGKHQLCDHRFSCLSTSIESSLRNFSLGLVLCSVLRLVRSGKKIVTNPRFPRHLFSFNTFKLPLFLAFLPLVYHSSHCLLRRITNRDNALFSAISGGLSGSAMCFFPNVSIAMYIFWKWVEMVYRYSVRTGRLPVYEHGDILLYTLSTSFVIFVATVQPHSIRKGYWHFLMKLTGNNVAQFNRPLFDIFGFDSSRMDPKFCPKLDPRSRLTTKDVGESFLESQRSNNFYMLILILAILLSPTSYEVYLFLVVMKKITIRNRLRLILDGHL